MSEDSNHIEVRGETSFNSKALLPLRAYSAFSDLIISILLGVSVIHLFKILPFPSLPLIGVMTGTGILYWAIQKTVFGITLGERIWHLKFKGIGLQLHQKDYLSGADRAKSLFLTLSTCVILALETQHFVFKNPLWIDSQFMPLESYVPKSIENWNITPFFYQLGAWPTYFENQPVFYSVSYQVGPPTRFVGKITAHLKDPDIQMIIEGPKTPSGNSGRLETMSQQNIKECFLNNLSSFKCKQIRLTSLARHIREIENRSHPKSWKLGWFQITTPSAEQPQGIYLQAQSSSSIQDRFIFIASNGTHQTLILNRTDSPEGDNAYKLFQQVAQTQQVFQSLDPGKSWINRTLESIQLERVKSIQDPHALVKALASIQMILISKISVDPAHLDAYYHLAGTSTLLAKDPRLLLAPASILGQREAIALKNLQSAVHFSKDVAPSDPRIKQMETMLIESKKR
jgi:hypothetical protein